MVFFSASPVIIFIIDNDSRYYRRFSNVLPKGEPVSRDDNVKVEGTVVKVHSGGMYQVETEDGRSILTKLSGRMSRYRIKVLLGDRVTVALSPYDLTHGLIIYRGK